MTTAGTNPFRGGPINVTPGPPNVWILSAAGVMDAPDSYICPTGNVLVTDFLPSPPGAGLPQTLNTPQRYHWFFPPGNRWVVFTASAPITVTLEVAGGGGFQVRTVAYGATVTVAYVGPTP